MGDLRSPGRPPSRIDSLSRARARDLRKNMTDAERGLWSALRQGRLHGCKFRRQQPIGSFVVEGFGVTGLHRLSEERFARRLEMLRRIAGVTAGATRRVGKASARTAAMA